nr:arabinofuranosyltransferase [Kibdelosporangium phytohabitans]
MLGGEIAAGVAVAAVVSVVLQIMVNRWFIPHPTNLPIAVATMCTVILVLVGVLLAARRVWPRWATPLTWAGLSALGTLALAFMLKGTRYYLGGVQEDQSFRLQYLARLTSSASLADMSYVDVPGFYPAGWFWLGGRFAHLTGLPSWAAFKPWAILTFAVIAVIAFALWSVLVERRVAVLIAMLTCIAGLRIGATEPYSWMAVAVIPPLAVLAWRMLRDLRRPDPAKLLGPVLVLGLFLGSFGAVYTLFFGFFGLVLVLLAVVNVVVAWRTGGKEIGRLVRRTLGRAGLVALIALGPVLLVWTPYLLELLAGHETKNLAARFLPTESIYLPTPMLEFSVNGALCMIGLIWLVLSLRRSPIAVALSVVAGTCYLWYLMSTVALAGGTTLLPFRTETILVTSLYCAAVLGAVDFARWAVTRVPAVRVRALAGVLAFAALLSLAQTVPLQHKRVIASAFNDYYPTGGNAHGVNDPGTPDFWYPQVDKAIQRMTGKKPEQLVILTNSWVLTSGQPYWTYISIIAQFGNPMIDHEARRTAVDGWARTTSSRDLIAQLDKAPGTPPSVFVFLRDDKNGGELHTRLSYDDYPRDPNTPSYEVIFKPSAFAGPEFIREDVGPHTVIVRR